MHYTELLRFACVDDELDLGYVAFEIGMAWDQDFPCRLAVQVSESGRPPRAFAALYCFEDYDVQRDPFDQTYRLLSEQLAGILGPRSSFGEYTYPHQKSWPYSYSWWSCPDATFVLVQDEFDIQFGMDVSLWVLPANVAVAFPMSLG